MLPLHDYIYALTSRLPSLDEGVDLIQYSFLLYGGLQSGPIVGRTSQEPCWDVTAYILRGVKGLIDVTLKDMVQISPSQLKYVPPFPTDDTS